MRAQRLLKSARDNLAAAYPDDPTDHHVRQATIDAYRAMFHTLAESNTTCIYSESLTDPDFAIHESAYRALNHSVWQIARSNEFRNEFTQPIVNFMSIGGRLKPKRERADYSSHHIQFSLLNAERDVSDAESAIAGFTAIHQNERHKLALFLLGNAR